jgi:hypothetical protein
MNELEDVKITSTHVRTDVHFASDECLSNKATILADKAINNESVKVSFGSHDQKLPHAN